MIAIVLPTGFSARPAIDGDQQAIAELCIALERHFYGDSHLSAQVLIGDINAAWNTEGIDREKDLLLVQAPDSQTIGYVMIYRSPDEPQTITASPVIHPNFHGMGLGNFLNEWAQQRAQQIAATLPPEKHVVLQSWIKHTDRLVHDLLTRAGFSPERYFRYMEIDLSKTLPVPAWPEGITVRSFIPGQDERATYEASAEAFSTNEDLYDNFSFEEWCRWDIGLESFDPSLAFLAIHHDQIIGTTFGWLLAGDNATIGWITDVAVRPAYRGQGIAQALLCHTFAVCKRRGATICSLNVDTANPNGAIHLYERAGMRESGRCDVRYQRVLREKL
jgi:mycothiol synthase